MKTEYYYTKDGADDWTVHGRRHHLQVVRTEAASGRTDRRGEDVLHTIFFVQDRRNVIDLSDQEEIEPHGFTRLKDAFSYAVDKLTEYDDRVDPRKARGNPDQFDIAIRAFPSCIVGGLDRPKTVSDLVYQALHEIDMFEEGQDGAISPRQAVAVRKFIQKFRTTER